ncbi:MAG TPA: hypothetical protein VGG06_15425 [Thermoanaerobaculia bacterium]
MSEVRICDVTLRDGLQALDREAEVPLALRLRLFDALRRARLPYVEVGSFVNPRVLPAMKVTPELLAAIAPGEAEIAVLVPKLRYFHEARRSPHVTTVALLVSASEAYSVLNTRMSTAEALAAAREVAASARREGYRARAYLSYSFRDFGEGNAPQPTETVVRLCGELLAAGCEMVAVADTNGTATPGDVARTLKAVERTVGLERVGVHFHDRYGLGITNCFVAYESGVRIFDGAIGGIGGNRMVKGSVSNVATEELAFMFHAIGVDTGTDFGALLEAGRVVEEMIGLLAAPPPQSKILLNRVEALPART